MVAAQRVMHQEQQDARPATIQKCYTTANAYVKYNFIQALC